ncbi:hypothetical protein AB1L88_23920 [Tautonia sp. JC769]|uniref:hypothetical protein n=1 Tax=Tautonia sp. JC769 TaxID=3232135 RepID=UPI00345B2136
MSGCDWFIVGCRLFGVWVAYTALTYITAYLDVRLGYTEEIGRSSQPGGLLIHGFGHLLLALYLLLGTRHLARLCYEDDEPPKTERGSSGLPTERDLA